MSDQAILDAMDVAMRSQQPLSGAPPLADSAATEAATALLEAAGWLAQQGSDERAPSSERGFVVGLDLGGTKLRGALSNAAGLIVDEYELPTDNRDEESSLRQMARMVADLADRSGINREAIVQIGVGVPGVVAPDGSVVLSPNVSFPASLPLAAAVAELVGVPVSVENDVNVAAFGEYIEGYGRGRGLGSLAFAALGTGIGLGLILEGRLVRGASGAAGEIATLPFGDDPFAGAKAHPGGAFEAAVATSGIIQRFKAASGEELGVRHIFERADSGDAVASKVVNDTLRYFAYGLAAVVALFDPGTIVIGGGIGARPGVAETVGGLVGALLPTPCRVVASGLGDRAGVVGAVALATRLARLSLIEGRAPGRHRGAAA